MRNLLEQLVGEMVEKGIDFHDAQRVFERHFIARVLQHCDGNVGKAADHLKIHRNTLARKIQEHKIKVGGR